MISIAQIKQARLRDTTCLYVYLILTKTLRIVRTTPICRWRNSFRKADWLAQGHSPRRWQARIWTYPHLMPNQFWCSELQWSGNSLLYMNIFIFHSSWIWLCEGLANSGNKERFFFRLKMSIKYIVLYNLCLGICKSCSVERSLKNRVSTLGCQRSMEGSCWQGKGSADIHIWGGVKWSSATSPYNFLSARSPTIKQSNHGGQNLVCNSKERYIIIEPTWVFQKKFALACQLGKSTSSPKWKLFIWPFLLW